MRDISFNGIDRSCVNKEAGKFLSGKPGILKVLASACRCIASQNTKDQAKYRHKHIERSSE
jgi:hypothetical protein